MCDSGGGKRVCVCDIVGCKRGGMRVNGGGGGKQMVNSGGVRWWWQACMCVRGGSK